MAFLLLWVVSFHYTEGGPIGTSVNCTNSIWDSPVDFCSLRFWLGKWFHKSLKSIESELSVLEMFSAYQCLSTFLFAPSVAFFFNSCPTFFVISTLFQRIQCRREAKPEFSPGMARNSNLEIWDVIEPTKKSTEHRKAQSNTIRNSTNLQLFIIFHHFPSFSMFFSIAPHCTSLPRDLETANLLNRGCPVCPVWTEDATAMGLGGGGGQDWPQCFSEGWENHKEKHEERKTLWKTMWKRWDLERTLIVAIEFGLELSMGPWGHGLGQNKIRSNSTSITIISEFNMESKNWLDITDDIWWYIWDIGYLMIYHYISIYQMDIYWIIGYPTNLCLYI